jgi:hypothetical protein
LERKEEGKERRDEPAEAASFPLARMLSLMGAFPSALSWLRILAVSRQVVRERRREEFGSAIGRLDGAGQQGIEIEPFEAEQMKVIWSGKKAMKVEGNSYPSSQVCEASMYESVEDHQHCHDERGYLMLSSKGQEGERTNLESSTLPVYALLIRLSDEYDERIQPFQRAQLFGLGRILQIPT